MKSIMWTALLSLGAAVAFGAPSGKVEPVAEGYPDWQGFSEKNYICGRRLTPSDMRHRFTIVVELEPTGSLQRQIANVGDLATLNGLAGFHAGENWETLVFPRDVLIVVVNRGEKDHDAFKKALVMPKTEDEVFRRTLGNMQHPSIAYYDDITFTGAPDTTGKRPYIYVMGPEGKEPIYQDQFGLKTDKEVRAAIGKAKKKLNADGFKWVPFFGSIEDPKSHPQYVKKVKEGKPLGQVVQAMQKDILAKDPEKAKEAQILYDASYQTCGDLVLRIRLEAMACPHRAYYDYKQLGNYWPGEKKQLKDIVLKMKTIPDATVLAEMFCKAMTWADPNFTCKNAGEAKKIIGELNKMKKTLEKLKESKTIVVQNGALLLDGQVDELISVMPTKVPEK